MHNSRRKTIATAISLFLILAMAASIVALPTANAQTVITGTMKTYPFIGATPNPVGVGQEVLLHVGITQQLAITQDGWEGLTVTVTRPDQTTETLGPFRTDATGGTGTIYTPAVEGTYKLQTHFPEQDYNRTSGFGPFATVYALTWAASDSEILELVVQADPIPIYPGQPLPSEYWTRPVDAQLHEWSTITGTWLTMGQFADSLAGSIRPNNDDAPETAHILWAKPQVTGGLAGDYLGNHAYHMGDAYEGYFSGTVILDGKVFYNKFNSIGSTSAVEHYVEAVDLHTGETLWSRPLVIPDGRTRRLDFGQVMYWDSFNVHGVFAYLWESTGSTWNAFDPVDGRWLFTFENVPGGTTLFGPNGEILRYQININGGYMTMWNSTAVIDAYWGDTPNSPVWGSWRPNGKTIDASGPCDITPSTPLGYNGYQWNVSIPTDLPGSADYWVALDYVTGWSRPTIGFGGEAINNPDFTVWALSLKPGQEGVLKFKKTYSAPPGNVTIGYRRYGTGDDRAFVIPFKEEFTRNVYDLDTGDFLWGPGEPEYYLSYLETWSIIYDGKLITHGTKGIVDCYDLYTGDKLWVYEVYDPYNQILWSNNWNCRVDFISDGKIYIRHSEHSPVDPMPRGAPYVCLNATTGEEVWRADGLFRGTDWGGRGYIGDSILVKSDTYDMRIYAIAKGPSATTVTAAPKISVHGSSVMVEGMVTDVSPGTEEYGLRARFPHGVPAVADEDMSEWMLYVYKNFPRPTDVAGVEVVIEVLDPNNNFYEVGRTTSDSSGFYKLMFTPDVPGEYTVIASFAGSKAYYGSFAETALGVEEAPQPTPPPTPTPAPMTDTYVMGFGIGIIVAIIIGFALLLLRKR